MHRELFEIPFLHLPVYGFGVAIVIGFLLGTQLARWLANRVGLNGELFVNAALLALVSGIIGARASHVIENWPEFSRPDRGVGQNLLEMVKLTEGGLTYYGGFLLAFPVLILYGRWKRIPIRVGMDIVAPVILIGLGFGRIGCFLNGCCYGAECNLPWSVQFPYGSPAYIDQSKARKIVVPGSLKEVHKDRSTTPMTDKQVRRDPSLAELAAKQKAIPLHPAQLYSSFTSLLLAGLCLAYFTLSHVPGRGFALMLMLESVTRFLLEMLRAEPTVWGRMSFSMVLSIPLLALGIILWFVFGRMSQPMRPDEAVAAALRS